MTGPVVPVAIRAASAAAAVVNAAHRATGVRVRDLPPTLDTVLPGLS